MAPPPPQPPRSLCSRRTRKSHEALHRALEQGGALPGKLSQPFLLTSGPLASGNGRWLQMRGHHRELGHRNPQSPRLERVLNPFANYGFVVCPFSAKEGSCWNWEQRNSGEIEARGHLLPQGPVLERASKGKAQRVTLGGPRPAARRAVGGPTAVLGPPRRCLREGSCRGSLSWGLGGSRGCWVEGGVRREP